MPPKKEKKSASTSSRVKRSSVNIDKLTEKFVLVKKPTKYKINVFAHISGPSGAGKSYLGKLLASHFIVKDLDEFLQTDAFISTMNELDHGTEFIGRVYDKIVRNIYEWVQNTERYTTLPIVFVGLSYVIARNKLMMFPIEAEWKYIIDIPIDTLMKQFIMRDLLYICNHKEQAMDAIINTANYSDRWKKENIKLSHEYTNTLYHAHSYVSIPAQDIEKRLILLLDLKKSLSFDFYPELMPPK